MQLKNKYVGILCPNCKKEFAIFNRKYDDEVSDLTKCTECDFEASRFSFDFVEEISTGDKIEYIGEDPSLINEEKGMTGTVFGIYPAGIIEFEKSSITINNTMFVIGFGDRLTGFMCLYHRGLLKKCSD
jgi:hypothetical protein